MHLKAVCEQPVNWEKKKFLVSSLSLFVVSWFAVDLQRHLFLISCGNTSCLSIRCAHGVIYSTTCAWMQYFSVAEKPWGVAESHSPLSLLCLPLYKPIDCSQLISVNNQGLIDSGNPSYLSQVYEIQCFSRGETEGERQQRGNASLFSFRILLSSTHSSSLLLELHLYLTDCL